MRKRISVLLAIAIVLSMASVGLTARSFAEETTVEIITSELGYDDAADVETVEKDGVSITFSKGSGSADPKYYNSGNAIRVYGSNTVTFSAASAITSIKVTFTGSSFTGSFTADVGTYELNDTVGTWTGSANTVVWTNNITKGNARFAKIEVTVGGSGSTEPEPTATSTGSTTPTTPEEILDALYALGEDEALEGTYTLTGKIISVDTAYNSRYENITVTIVVGDHTDKPVKCYRLKGSGADALKVNDVITVEGKLKNYRGTPEFDEGCALKDVVPAPTESTEPQPTPSTPEEILNAVYGLATNGKLDGEYTLTGKITKINTEYNPEFGNITVTIVVGDFTDKPLQCYRLAGEGVDALKVNDVITVKGKLKKYNDTPEFDAGCQLLAVEAASDPEPSPTNPPSTDPTPRPETPEEILNAVYALEPGAALEGEYSLRGKITVINDAFSSRFNNITVTIVVEGFDDKPIKCFRMTGEGADTLKVNDVITVTGKLLNYQGTPEFDAGCVVSDIVAGEASSDPLPTTPEEIVAALYALQPGESRPETFTLTGVITQIDTPYSEDYRNITVTMVVGNMTDKPVMCYRLGGQGADDLAVGDTITVSGTFKNHNGTHEFAQDCTLDNVVKAQQPQPQTGDFALAAFAGVIVLAMSAALVLRRKKA